MGFPIQVLKMRNAAPLATYGFVSAGALAATTGAGTAVVVDFPSGVATNDILILTVACIPETGTAAPVTPSGWTQVANLGPGGLAAQRFTVFWRRAASAESGTVSVSFTGTTGANTTQAGIMSVWRGCVTTGNPFVNVSQNSGNSASVGAPSVATNAANQLVANFLVQTQVLSTYTPPANYTEAYDTNTTTGLDVSFSANNRVWPSAGATGAQQTVATVSGRWAVVSFGLVRA